MDKETLKNIIYGLRCSGSKPSDWGERHCAECVYATKEKLGENEWYACDCDRIAMDAAEALEKVMEENNG